MSHTVTLVITLAATLSAAMHADVSTIRPIVNPLTPHITNTDTVKRPILPWVYHNGSPVSGHAPRIRHHKITVYRVRLYRVRQYSSSWRK